MTTQNAPCLAFTDRFSYAKAVRTADGLTVQARCLALILSTCLDPDGTIPPRFTPSTATLTHDMGYTPKNLHSVGEAMAELERAGYLRVTRTRGRRNSYQVTVPVTRAREFLGVTRPIALTPEGRTTAAQDSGSASVTTAAQDSGSVSVTTAARGSGATAPGGSGSPETTAPQSSQPTKDPTTPQPSLPAKTPADGPAGPGSTPREGKEKKLSQKSDNRGGRARPGRPLAEALTGKQRARYRQMLDNMRAYFDREDVLGREGTRLVASIEQLDQQTRFAEMLIHLDELGHTQLLTDALQANRNASKFGTAYAGLRNPGAEAYRRIEELYATHGSGPSTSLSDLLPEGLRVGSAVVTLPRTWSTPPLPLARSLPRRTP